jgi:adenosylcobinamide kinase/adenosylcobinamide-phosphate guanylyltransferase
MKILYWGASRSGKSMLAEERARELARGRQIGYIATYDGSYHDEEMRARVLLHRRRRGEEFVTIEESMEPSRVLEEGGIYLLDSFSMWIFNTLAREYEEVESMTKELFESSCDLILVADDTGGGLIPDDAQSRLFAERNAAMSALCARLCDEVVEVKLGMEFRLK